MFWKKKPPTPPLPPPTTNDEPPGEIDALARVKHMCWIAKMSAEGYAEMSAEDRREEFGQYEHDRYKKFFTDAISLARTITDEFYRDAALHQLINVMAAHEEDHARKLFQVMEVDVTQEAVLKDFPQLGARF